MLVRDLLSSEIEEKLEFKREETEQLIPPDMAIVMVFAVASLSKNTCQFTPCR
jgi:hypothetical protein